MLQCTDIKKQPTADIIDGNVQLHNLSRSLAVLIQCHDSTGSDEMGDYFAIEADTMIDIVRVT